MDAVEFFKKKERMCVAFGDTCIDCQIHSKANELGELCSTYVYRYPAEAVEIVERWAKEHPRKTRQSEFLKMFPRTGLGDDGLVGFCPEDMDSEFVCPRKEYDSEGNRCERCRRKYWLEEVEEDGD